MSSRTQRRLRQQTRSQAHRLTTGSWGSPSADAPDFGPVNPPTDQASAGQTERIVKDVVRCGRFHSGFDPAGKPVYWNITPQTLTQIVANFKAMKAAGQRPNLGKTHGDENLLIHPDDLIAPIDDLKVVGDTLWMAAYVAPDDAKYLANPARKVSIGAFPNYEDSERRRYPGDSLLHVAVTDRPAVNGQGPFMAMADGAVSGGGSMDFAALLTAVNGFMEALGYAALPDDTSEENIVDRLVGVTAAMGKTAEPAATPAPEGTDAMPPADSLEMTGVPAAMRDTLKKWTDGVVQKIDERDKTIKELSDKLTARDKADADAAKAAFDAECENVKKVPDARGYVATEVEVETIRKLANSLGTYDLRLLKTINRPLKLGGGVARSLASSEPSSPIAMADQVNSPEARKLAAQNIAEHRGIALEQAMKFLPKIAG